MKYGRVFLSFLGNIWVCDKVLNDSIHVKKQDFWSMSFPLKFCIFKDNITKSLPTLPQMLMPLETISLFLNNFSSFSILKLSKMIKSKRKEKLRKSHYLIFYLCHKNTIAIKFCMNLDFKGIKTLDHKSRIL